MKKQHKLILPLVTVTWIPLFVDLLNHLIVKMYLRVADATTQYNKEHLHFTSSHYLRCRWGHNESRRKSRFVPVGTKVSLGTQRPLCRDAQEQRSRRAVRRRNCVVW